MEVQVLFSALMCETEQISNDIDVIVAAYDEVSNGRGTPAADHERALSKIVLTDDIVDYDATEV